MATLKFSVLILSALITLNAAGHESSGKDEDVAVHVENNLTEAKSTKTTENNRGRDNSVRNDEKAEAKTSWEDGDSDNRIDPNLDGLILLACIVGLVLFIVVLRYVCCTIEQCEEQAKKSLANRADPQYKVERTEKEIILHGMKYKSLV